MKIPVDLDKKIFLEDEAKRTYFFIVPHQNLGNYQKP